MSYDLFISYAHADDRDDNRGKVTALVEAIKADYRRVTGVPLQVFFDTHAIRTMDDWEARILTGLRHSKMMVAVLSPSYFQSDFCRREWEIYVESELAQALPGDGIAPIYVVKHPAFDADPVDETLRHWIKDLRRRQYIEWRSFWPEGAQALEREDVRRKLADLPGQIKERLERATIRDNSPNTVPLPSVHFVGRVDEMHGAAQRPDSRPDWRDHGRARHSGHRQEHAGVCLCLGLWLQVSRRPVLDPGGQPDRPGRRRDRAGRTQGGRAGRRRSADTRKSPWPR